MTHPHQARPQARVRTWLCLSLAAIILPLAGCKSGPRPLYDWGPYQPKVYEQLKGTGNGPEAQISELEEHLAEAESEQLRVPTRLRPPRLTCDVAPRGELRRRGSGSTTAATSRTFLAFVRSKSKASRCRRRWSRS